MRRATVRRALTEGHTVDNLALEINSKDFALGRPSGSPTATTSAAIMPVAVPYPVPTIADLLVALTAAQPTTASGR